MDYNPIENALLVLNDKKDHGSEIREENIAAAIKELMSTQYGRTLISELLKISGFAKDDFATNEIDLAYNAGLRKAGLFLFNKIACYTPHLMGKIFEEQK